MTTWFVYGPKDGIIKILEKTPFEITYAPDTLQIVDDPSVRAAVGEFMKCSVLISFIALYNYRKVVNRS